MAEKWRHGSSKNLCTFDPFLQLLTPVEKVQIYTENAYLSGQNRLFAKMASKSENRSGLAKTRCKMALFFRVLGCPSAEVPRVFSDRAYFYDLIAYILSTSERTCPPNGLNRYFWCFFFHDPSKSMLN